MTLARLREALTENRAETRPDHDDPSLRGRTYAIPFASVWAAALDLASGGLRGWTAVEADEDRGVIRAESRTLLLRLVDDVQIRMALDENGQTRVDVSSQSRVGRGDLGQNARRIRTFFRVLDRRIGAGPGTILDPTLPLFGTALALLFLLAGCGTADQGRDSTAAQDSTAQPATRNFPVRKYERDIVFLSAQGDSTLLVPWSFAAESRPDGVSRQIRGWLARNGAWDPFLQETWEGRPMRDAWRILPRGPVGLIVGPGDALERILFQEPGRNLEVVLGPLLVEWTGQQAQGYRVHEGTLILSDQTVDGIVLDLTRAGTPQSRPPGDWCFLVSGDSLQLIMENLDPGASSEGGSYAVRARVEFRQEQWQGVRLRWAETRPFEAARRDVPFTWALESTEGDLAGTLTAESDFTEALEGEGPVLPLHALFQVSGTLTLDDRDFPVWGIVRHRQN